jgi:hypothetical protein
MDVENPLHNDDIPVAKLICIEVMGQILEDSERESNNVVIVVDNSCRKCIYNVCSCCCACLVFMVCFGGFFIFITGFPFAYY